MNSGIVTAYARSQTGARTGGSLLACGLWMRGAYIGASATAIGVVQLFQGDWNALTAVSTVAAGVALAVLSYRQAQAALDSDDKRTTIAVARPAAAHR